MVKSDFVKLVSGKCGLTQKDVKSVIDVLDEAIAEVCKAEDFVVLGNVKVTGVKVPAHEARNPGNGEKVQVPEKITIKAKAMPSLKKVINE